MLNIFHAAVISAEMHGDQPRRGVVGAYKYHPQRVHWHLMQCYPEASLDIQIAMLFHDVVEDGRATWQDLRDAKVSELSISYLEILTRREGESSEEHFNRVLGCGVIEVLYGKLADSTDNAEWSDEDKLWNPEWEREQAKYIARNKLLKYQIGGLS